MFWSKCLDSVLVSALVMFWLKCIDSAPVSNEIAFSQKQFDSVLVSAFVANLHINMCTIKAPTKPNDF